MYQDFVLLSHFTVCDVLMLELRLTKLSAGWYRGSRGHFCGSQQNYGPVVPRKSGLHGRGVGERLIALESW